MRKFGSTLLGLACVALVSASAMADVPALKRAATKVSAKSLGKPVNMKPYAYYNHETGELRYANGGASQVTSQNRVDTQVYNNRTKTFGLSPLNIALDPQAWEVDPNGLGNDPNNIAIWIYAMSNVVGGVYEAPNFPCANPGGDPNLQALGCLFDQVRDDYLADFTAFGFDGNDPSTFSRPMRSSVITAILGAVPSQPNGRLNCLFTEILDGNGNQTGATNGNSPCYLFTGAALANLLIDANAYNGDANFPDSTASVIGFMGYDWFNTGIVESTPGSGIFDTGVPAEGVGLCFGAGRRCVAVPFGVDPNLCPDIGDPNFFGEPNQFTQLGIADGGFWIQGNSAVLGEMINNPTLFVDQFFGLGSAWNVSFFISASDPNIALANNLANEFTVDVGGVVGCPLPGCVCDVDGDCDVDLGDLSGLLSGFGAMAGDPGFVASANCAVDEDGDPNTPEVLGLADLAGLLSEFGTDCDPNGP